MYTQTFPSVFFHRCRCVSVKCVERVLSVLEARVNVCRGESLRRLEFSYSVTYTQKENPLDLIHVYVADQKVERNGGGKSDGRGSGTALHRTSAVRIRVNP